MICMMRIYIDHRGVSDRVPGVDEYYFIDEEWTRLEPKWRTVFSKYISPALSNLAQVIDMKDILNIFFSIYLHT